MVVRVEHYTLVETLRARAQRQGQQKAYIYLNDGEQEEISISYAELDHKARVIAGRLQESGAAGGRVLLLYPQGIEYIAAFFGCLYAGSVAVPLYLPAAIQFKRTMPRFRAIVESAQPAAILTTAAMTGLVAESLDRQTATTIPCLASDDLAWGWAEEWREPEITPHHLALLQYTSGSTSLPRGVMVSHGNLIHNFKLLRHAAEYPEKSTYVSWLPLFHDMGLIGNALQSLYWGYECILFSPLAFLQKPFRWLQAISRYQADTSGAPNFAYDLCVEKISAEQRATLDLSSWRQAFNGSEHIRIGTLERFATVFAESGFSKKALRPLYGLAESTLFVTFSTNNKAPKALSIDSNELRNNRVVVCSNEHSHASQFVSCGNTCLDQRICIVDPETERICQPDQIGEIWVSGPSVAQGYWDREEETRKTFGAYLANGQGPYMRTGDLGFLHENELYITGRLKDLIIVDGRNHYPQDIELTVEQSHEALRSNNSAAFALDREETEQVIIVAEIDRHYEAESAAPQTSLPMRIRITKESLIKAIRQAVAQQHDLQVKEIVFIKPGSIPKTSSGKIQRHMCREKFLAGTLDLWGGSNGSALLSRK
ncbi:MAG TPA: fatty acyl-AMP ligase [Ktedonobacteraceae bacterium]